MVSLCERIFQLKKEKKAIILAHNYCLPEVQDVADHVGDSLGLSLIASRADADVIVFCGVSFMAESAKILNPSKIVLIPEPAAKCAMASMCTASQIREVKSKNPGSQTIGYINSTAESKTEMDMCCTSSNASEAVMSLESANIIFVPDANLASYVASKNPQKNIIKWDGYCPIHQSLTADAVTQLKEKYPGSIILAHPECRDEVLNMADMVGSTEKMLTWAKTMKGSEFIVATEIGMRHRLEKECPGKKFHFIDHSVCSAMKMTNLRSIVRAMENMDCKVELDIEVIRKAAVPLQRMIELK